MDLDTPLENHLPFPELWRPYRVPFPHHENVKDLEWYELIDPTPIYREINLYYQRNDSVQQREQQQQQQQQQQQGKTENNNFKGTIVVSLMKSNISRLYSGNVKYWMSRKSDGIRLQCLISSTLGEMVYIDRAGRVIMPKPVFALVLKDMKLQNETQNNNNNPLSASSEADSSSSSSSDSNHNTYKLHNPPMPSEFYLGTLLDGELVWNKKHLNWEYQAWDTIAMKGISCRTHSYRQRVQIAQNMLVVWYYYLYRHDPDMVEKLHRDDETIKSIESDEYNTFQKRWTVHCKSYPIRFWVKPIFHLWEINNVRKRIMPKWLEEFDQDGDILTPNHEVSTSGYAASNFKYKPVHPLDLQLMWKTHDEMNRIKMVQVPPPEIREKLKSYPLVPCLYTYELLAPSDSHSDTKATTRELCFTTALFDDKQWRHQKHWNNPSNQMDLQNKIVDCSYNYHKKTWEIMSLREKKYANAWPTVQKTLKNIKENLQDEDVYPFLKHPDAIQNDFSPSLLTYKALGLSEPLSSTRGITVRMADVMKHLHVVRSTAQKTIDVKVEVNPLPPFSSS
jgi:hypothetical protein